MYIRHTVRCKKIGEKTREGKGVEEDEEEEEEEEKERVCWKFYGREHDSAGRRRGRTIVSRFRNARKSVQVNKGETASGQKEKRSKRTYRR